MATRNPCRFFAHDHHSGRWWGAVVLAFVGLAVAGALEPRVLVDASTPLPDGPVDHEEVALLIEEAGAEIDILMRGRLADGKLTGRPKVMAWRTTGPESGSLEAVCERASLRQTDAGFELDLACLIEDGGGRYEIEARLETDPATSSGAVAVLPQVAGTALHGTLFHGRATGTRFPDDATEEALEATAVLAVQAGSAAGGPWTNAGDWRATITNGKPGWRIAVATAPTGLPEDRHVDLRLRLPEAVDLRGYASLAIDYRVGPGASGLPFTLQLNTGSETWYGADQLLRSRPGEHRVDIPLSALTWQRGPIAGWQVPLAAVTGIGLQLEARPGAGPIGDSVIILDRIVALPATGQADTPDTPDNPDATGARATATTSVHFTTRCTINGCGRLVDTAFGVAPHGSGDGRPGQRSRRVELGAPPASLPTLVVAEATSGRLPTRPCRALAVPPTWLREAEILDQLTARVPETIGTVLVTPPGGLGRSRWQQLDAGLRSDIDLLRTRLPAAQVGLQLELPEREPESVLAIAEVAAAVLGGQTGHALPIWQHEAAQRAERLPTPTHRRSLLLINRQLALICAWHRSQPHRLCGLSTSDGPGPALTGAVTTALDFCQPLRGALVRVEHPDTGVAVLATRRGAQGALLLVNRDAAPTTLRCHLPDLRPEHCRELRRLYLLNGRLELDTAAVQAGSDATGTLQLDVLLPGFASGLVLFEDLPAVAFEERRTLRFAETADGRGGCWPLAAGERLELRVPEAPAGPSRLRLVAEDLQQDEAKLMLDLLSIALPSSATRPLGIHELALPTGIDLDDLIVQASNDGDGCLLGSLAFEWIQTYKIFD